MTTPAELKSQIRGIIAFAPTPFTTDDLVDFDALAQHVDRLATSGAHVVVVCGGVAEYVSLEMDEYRESIRVGVEAAGGRVPLLAGIGHSTRIASGLAAHAAKCGADGLMINPLYFIDPSDDGLIEHYRQIGTASGLGMMIFSTKGQVYSPDLVERIAAVPEVIALKDEWGDLDLFIQTRERLGNRLAWVNGMAETLATPYFAAGADAFTTGIINFAPELSRKVWELGSTGQTAELDVFIQTQIRPIAQLRKKRKGYSISVIKAAMHQLGYCENILRSPLTPILEEDRTELLAILTARS